jgi:hypothetical protein
MPPKPLHTGLLTMRLRTISLAFAFLCALPICASVGLIVSEPFGNFGTMLPVGHAGVYLNHLCAETPTHLRPCRRGEFGVVISRYHDLRHPELDWLATPVIPFLYGVEDPANAPTFMTAAIESRPREQYRQAHLLAVVPDVIDKQGLLKPPHFGDWGESIGAAFDRRLFLYTIDSTSAQDAAILNYLNSDPNHRHYTLGRNNCADFAADLLTLVLPQEQQEVFHRNFFGDFDMTTPKNLARRMEAFGFTHPELHPRSYIIPQIPGTLRRSRPLRGSAETFVKTKRYLATLIVIQPELIFADWIFYESAGKWKLGLNATTIQPSDWNCGVPAQPDVTFNSAVSLHPCATASQSLSSAASAYPAAP